MEPWTTHRSEAAGGVPDGGVVIHVDDREALTSVRSIMARGEHADLDTVLRDEPWPGDSLQLIGDGLLAAVLARAEGAADLARACVTALRGWEGDRELADAIEATLGSGPTRIDLRTGEVWPQYALEYAEEAGDIDDLDGESFADRLARAISGRGALRRSVATAEHLGSWSRVRISLTPAPSETPVAFARSTP